MDANPRPNSTEPVPTFSEWWAEFTLMRVGVRPSTLLRDKSVFNCHLKD